MSAAMLIMLMLWCGLAAAQTRPPAWETAVANLPAQRIGANDLIAVSVYAAPEFTRTVRVGADGLIRLPMLKRRLQAQELLPADLEVAIAEALQAEQLIVHPVVSVTVMEYHSRPISVAGAVRNPVTFQAVGPVTLLDALTRAGGLSPQAGPEILVSRAQPGQDGAPTVLIQRIPVDGLIDQADPDLNLRLAGGEEIRDVAVEDLLGRSPVCLDESALRRKLQGRVVLVTGAAGSIGSELCRQIARYQPAAIVAFEIAETALFHLEREMRQAFPAVPFHAEIGSIQRPGRLDEVFRLHRPAIVYHAAAYKHVPLMEAHVFEALENNVFGTWNTALTAAEYGATDFVLISSDKAVRSANVMGATKRLAELLVLSLQNGRTRYVAVRFGNVLGSSGSVIPVFKQQIAAGGPVTVTHPEMRRFFMTIPEACQLVLQASTMSRGGEIFVLDMGEPVRILDLARNLILLSGLRPGVDIRIEFSGVRPGEKLYEELSTILEDTLPTSHEKIKIFAGNGLPEGSMTARLALLREICAARDLAQLIVTLKDVIPDYSPSAHLLRRALPSPRPSAVSA